MENKKFSEFDSFSFEENINTLEEIAKKLEKGNLNLDEALLLFEKGNYLRNLCEKKLNETKMKIEKIINVSESEKSNKKEFAITTDDL